MTARARSTYKRRVSLTYQYGFIPPGQKDLVACGSLHEAQFFAAFGARLMVREVETKMGDWQEIERL
ncbi:hypothetical protein GCM10029976_090360 [Kribbella albertanoniae]|uniref:Uncharacterized protein n=1 Tax=Kribbella albertanoniae TaxID=1266829 RepID=A0A4V2XPK8_9ACTN|nr:hypothetical protein [Kribbella albertanoniae]TDC22485.1 hypothetical protein E1261_30715 [Kribbella albertanoniae]